MKNTNHKPRIGEEILILQCNNSQPKNIENTLQKVISIAHGHFIIKTSNGSTYTFYETAPADEWTFPRKEHQIKSLENQLIDNNEKVDELTVKNMELSRQLDILKNYESEDEYMLEQLDLVLNLPGTNKKEVRLEALKIIREKSFI